MEEGATSLRESEEGMVEVDLVGFVGVDGRSELYEEAVHQGVEERSAEAHFDGQAG